MKNRLIKLSLLPLAAAISVGCSSSNSDSSAAPAVDAQFSISVTNLTNNQPFSPEAVILHQAGFNAFNDGQAATTGLEELAEGGSPTAFLGEAENASQHIASVAGVGPTPPRQAGDAVMLNVPASELNNLRLTVATMLVNTNDAFTGLNAVDVSNMNIGQSMRFTGPSWDSGTEDNLETAATMPGPVAQTAGGGGAPAGFDAIRDDSVASVVRIHQGAVTMANSNDASAEGLATSILTEGDRWDNPASRIVITRTQ